MFSRFWRIGLPLSTAWLLIATVATAQTSPHLILGNPSKATADPSKKTDFLMTKPEFALAYNDSKGTPNWVSWRLLKADLGDSDRQPFFADPELPKAFRKVLPGDYRNGSTAMTRGHMCPHADRAHDVKSGTATFVMTNMVPQSHALNAGAWEKLERYLRGLASGREADKPKELYIVAGPHGQGGRSEKGSFTTTDGKVVVPAKCWKVALVIDAGPGDPLIRINDRARIIAVIMPNTLQPENDDWVKYGVKLTEVEALTGYKFFDKAPSSVMDRLRSLPKEKAGRFD